MLKYSNIQFKKILLDRGLSITELANLVGTSKQNLSRILQNDDIKLTTFLEICDALKVNPSDLLGRQHNDDNLLNDPPVPYGRKTESEILFELEKRVTELEKKLGSKK
jgi:DNA-binding Xre family transcriptional regulator